MHRCDHCVKATRAPWKNGPWCSDAFFDEEEYGEDENWGPDCGGPYSNIYVNVYLVERCYGGPEEGGGWYDAGEPIESRAVDTLQEADDERTWLEKYRYSNAERAPLHSARSAGEYRVDIETHFARSFPKEKPHYE